MYKLSRTALKAKARFVKVNHDLLHIVLQVNQSKISLESTRKDCNDILVLFVTLRAESPSIEGDSARRVVVRGADFQIVCKKQQGHIITYDA